MKRRLFKDGEAANVEPGSGAEAHFLAAGWRSVDDPPKRAPAKKRAKVKAKE